MEKPEGPAGKGKEEGEEAGNETEEKEKGVGGTRRRSPLFLLSPFSVFKSRKPLRSRLSLPPLFLTKSFVGKVGGGGFPPTTPS